MSFFIATQSKVLFVLVVISNLLRATDIQKPVTMGQVHDVEQTYFIKIDDVTKVDAT